MTEYRTGDHNPRNIYRAGMDRDTDEHMGVMFTPEAARLAVLALNTLAAGEHIANAVGECSDQEATTYQPEPYMSFGGALRNLADAFDRIEAYDR